MFISRSLSDNKVPALPLHHNANDKRTDVCEFCGIACKHDETTLKLCNGRIRAVCFICQHEIADYEAGIDITSSEYNVSPRPGEVR